MEDCLLGGISKDTKGTDVSGDVYVCDITDIFGNS